MVTHNVIIIIHDFPFRRTNVFKYEKLQTLESVHYLEKLIGSCLRIAWTSIDQNIDLLNLKKKKTIITIKMYVVLNNFLWL